MSLKLGKVGVVSVLVAGVALVATACGSDPTATPTTAPVTTPTPAPTSTSAPDPTPAPTSVATGPQTIELNPSRDTTLFDDGPSTLANGEGEWLFAGVTQRGAIRRALIAFDIAGAMPAGATVQDVSLQLMLSQTTALDEPVTLYRVETAWNEGTADADYNEGRGGPAGPGDPTWLGTGIGDAQWTAAGGDFASAESSTLSVGKKGLASDWSSPKMIADAQAWLDDPASNNGWILLGNEGGTRTAKRFDSNENFSGFPEIMPPVLTITYLPAS